LYAVRANCQKSARPAAASAGAYSALGSYSERTSRNGLTHVAQIVSQDALTACRVDAVASAALRRQTIASREDLMPNRRSFAHLVNCKRKVNVRSR
jgi:hypothetical protein